MKTKNIDDSGGPDACWPWRGSHTKQGYALGSRTTASREVYEELRGPIPKGMEIDHLCRNRGCVNPKHLETVTHRENIRRSPLIAARCVKMARDSSKLNEKSVAEIRDLHAQGRTPTWIAKKFGLHPKSINRIVTGKRWGTLMQSA